VGDSRIWTYLGDGAFVEHDGWSLVLTTSDGARTTNRIVLEPEVYAALVAFVARLKPAVADEGAARG